MRDDTEFNFSELRRKHGEHATQRESPNGTEGRFRFHANGFHSSAHAEATADEPRRSRSGAVADEASEESEEDLAAPEGSVHSLPFDPIRVVEALLRKWWLWLGAGLVLGGLGFCLTAWDKKISVTADLIRREAPSVQSAEGAEAFKPQQFSEQTLIGMLKAPEVLNRVSEKSQPPLGAAELAWGVGIIPSEATEVVTVVLSLKRTPDQLISALNTYLDEFVIYTKEVQVRDAREALVFIDKKLKDLTAELEQANNQMSGFSAEAKFLSPDKQVETYLTQLSDIDLKTETTRIELESLGYKKLQAAKDELANLLLRYTEIHPYVQAQKSKIEAIEKSMAHPPADVVEALGPKGASARIDVTSPDAESLLRRLQEYKLLREGIQNKMKGLSEKNLTYANARSRYASLESLKVNLENRRRVVELYEQGATGYYRVFNPATPDRIIEERSTKKMLVFTIGGLFFGIFGAMGFVGVREILDDKVRTTADVERATGLPILATLGDLKSMSEADQSKWAFRAWTTLKGKLDGSPSRGLVCGFISARAGEGRTTWINLLKKTAHERGLRVLTVATQPSEEPPVHPHDPPDPAADEQTRALVKAARTGGALAFPSPTMESLDDANGQSIVHIPLPGWVWNLDRRRQWENALKNWQKIPNLVLLVELPPASEPESVLLAEKLPRIIWLADSGKASLNETRSALETLRHAGCNMVGAVLNREPRESLKKHFARWLPLLALFLATSVFAETPENPPPSASPGEPRSAITNALFSMQNSNQRAAWQQHLTLGPGDILNFGLFGETNFNRTDVVVGPDGRVSYLQAVDIMASGLTIDQLRELIDKRLAKFYRAPRTIITPVTYRSKKYFMLGKVNTKGVFTLDRPITLLEAVARARGLESGLLERTSMELADLQKTFLIRHGERLPIDFERLFLEGDLSQNVAIEPDDYIYFPSANVKEIYVLGEVRTPGVMSYVSDPTVITAVSSRGGFTDRAYKSRVLVVRGSLQKPETFVVDTHAILDARQPDFVLQPKDIVYVHSRPFIKAEELLDVAATAFIQSATAGWAGFHVGPVIGKPIIPGPQSD
jgi:protein involved in polysaccharide export with SLBB domain/uncharacterized protein involved in exopolysaccharide biosynthesis